MSGRVPLILDVDPGIDDALALAYAVRSPTAEVVAVTTLAGNVDVERTTANTLAVLDWLGEHEIPVHRGASRPLARPHRDASYFHDATGLGTARIPASGRSVGPDRGPAAIIRLATARPQELTLVCTGPLTNLAIALNVEPGLVNLVREVVVMGGAFWVSGNITPVAEFNVFADPEAAGQVFAAPFGRLTVVGLDVTHQVAMSRATWEAAARADGTDPATKLAVAVCRQAFAERDLAGVYLHDPLAVAVALDDSLLQWEQAAVAVDTSDDARGQTRIVGPGRLRVARAVDSGRFLSAFSSALNVPNLSVNESAGG